MAQPSISSFFITRKRGLEDDAISSKKKVICLERTRNASESHECDSDSEKFGTVIVFPKARDSGSSNDDEPKTMVKKQTVRQGVTPQRRAGSKRVVHMQDVDGIEAPKVINFWKGGNLSPQKKPRVISETAISQSETKTSVNEVGHSTPVKKRAPTTRSSDTVETTPLISNNGMNLDEIKKKLKRSSRLTELKTSLNKLRSGMDKLDQMEAKRIANDSIKDKRESTPKSLKPFKTIELEILR